jgi:hypothetical protein
MLSHVVVGCALAVADLEGASEGAVVGKASGTMNPSGAIVVAAAMPGGGEM